MQVDENKYIIPCDVGCLDHVIGIDYFNWEEQGEEPNLYFETLHSPYHTLGHRIKAAICHILKSEELSWDSTTIGRKDAEEMKKILNKYITEYDYWRDNFNG